MQRKKLLAIAFPVQIVIVKVLSLFPQFTERFYSNGIYPYIAKASRIVFGFFGFSMGDILYGIIIILSLRWLWKRRKTWRNQYRQNLISICAALSVFYFLFNFLWALNYNRVPLYKKMAIEKDYSTQQLVTFTKKLIIRTNALQFAITHNDTAKVVSPYTQQEIYTKSLNGYANLARQFSYFSYTDESIKSSLISVPLSYMGFGGYLNPFTNEAQVNSKLPLYNLPTTTCHEMAHQLGYANESEANFIGFMASIYSDDVYFQYSGYSFALRYCMNNIGRKDKALAKSLATLIHTGIRKNYRESDHFNKEYESFVEDIFKYVYDNYLKINNQKDGLETYSKFVGLMVNYYSDKQL